MKTQEEINMEVFRWRAEVSNTRMMMQTERLVKDLEAGEMEIANNRLEVAGESGNIRLICNYTLSDRKPRGLILWVNPAEEMKLTKWQEDRFEEYAYYKIKSWYE